MQAIIMAAGKGSRISRLTGDMPKSFLEISGKKLIDRTIDTLKSAGILDIIIVIGYQADMFIEKYKADKHIRLIYNPFYDYGNVLTSFWFGQELLCKDFIYVHADTIFDSTILDMVLESKEDVVLPYDSKPCDEEAMKIRLVGRRILEINKTMDCKCADGEFIGMLKISNKVINDLKRTTLCLLKEQKLSSYFESAIQRLIDLQTFDIISLDITGKFWAEIDFIEDFIRAKKKLMS
jgi:choline kinase